MCKIDHWEWLRGYASLPHHIDLVLTDDCNLNCSYCPRLLMQRDNVGGVETVYMETGRVLNLLDEFSFFQPQPKLRLFGGEPFLHPEWDVIVQYALEKGLLCSCVTNGTLISSQAERILKSGIGAVGISLDGHEASLSKERGKNTFESAIEGLDELNRLKKRHNKKYPVIQVYTTVHARNVNHLVDFAYFLQGRNISLYRIQQLIWVSSKQLERSLSIIENYLGDGKFFGPEAGFIRSTAPNIDCEVLSRQIKELKELEFPFPVIFHPDVSIDELMTYHAYDYKRDFPTRCRTIENCSYIDPKGRLYPCLTVDMGNTFEKPFRSLWNGPLFRKFRRMIRREGRLPVCIRCPA